MKNLFQGARKYVLAASAMIMTFAMSVCAFASSTTPTVVTPDDWSSIISAMTAQISVSTIVGVVASTIAAGIGIVFMWWGGRKAVRALMSAFRKGRLSV